MFESLTITANLVYRGTLRGETISSFISDFFYNRINLHCFSLPGTRKMPLHQIARYIHVTIFGRRRFYMTGLASVWAMARRRPI